MEIARGTLPAIVSAAASQCVREILHKGQCRVLQPLMNICVTVPKEQVHDVLGDLSQRHARMKEIEVLDEETRCVVAECPLAEMMHLSRDIRTITHGLAHIDIQLGRYEPLDGDQLQKLQNQQTGFPSSYAR